MFNARFLLAALVLAGSALAACSGNFGAGTTAPGQVIPSGPLNPSSPTPTPNSANGIVTYGESDAMQPLPSVGGYGGAIAFSVPSPKPSGFDNVAVGVTVALVAPADTPDLNAQVGGGKRPRRRERPARPLLYVTLLATRDITLTAYPRIAIDVPRNVVTTYREEELGLAFYNSADKSKAYRLAVAAQESRAPSPAPSGSGAPAGAAPTGSASPTPTPTPTAQPSATPSPSPLPAGRTPAPASSPSPSPSPTLPPQRITFAPAATALKLTANKPATFALYALPSPAPSPTAAVRGATARDLVSPAPTGSGSAEPDEAPSVTAPQSPSAAAPAAPAAPGAPAGPNVPTASPGRSS